MRKARQNEADQLTAISFAAKAYWHYPDSYMRIWTPELTIDRDYLRKNLVFVHEKDQEITGYYSLVHLQQDLHTQVLVLSKGWWLDHMFILPQHIGHGIGRNMFAHLRALCGRQCITRVDILADPNASDFYRKMGCHLLCEEQSSIAGRTTPHFVFIPCRYKQTCRGPDKVG